MNKVATIWHWRRFAMIKIFSHFFLKTPNTLSTQTASVSHATNRQYPLFGRTWTMTFAEWHNEGQKFHKFNICTRGHFSSQNTAPPTSFYKKNSHQQYNSKFPTCLINSFSSFIFPSSFFLNVFLRVWVSSGGFSLPKISRLWMSNPKNPVLNEHLLPPTLC